MSTTSVNQYKIYCVTESIYVVGWSVEAPTTCYNNNTHSINDQSIQLLQTINTNIVNIKEDKIDVGRNTWVDCISLLDVAPGTSRVVQYSFPIPVSLYSFMFISDSTNKGDVLSLATNPTTMGLIKTDLVVGVNSFHAPAALLGYGSVGFYVSVADDTNTNDLGMITSINKTTGIVSTLKSTTNTFSTTNTVVRMTVRVLNQLRICGPGIYRFFDDVIGGAPINRETTVNFTYTNNASSGDNKELSIYLTCLF